MSGRTLLEGLQRETRFEGRPGDPFGLDIYALRSAASAYGKAVEPEDAEQAAALATPHGGLAARARLIDLGGQTRIAVALGVLCRPHEAERVSRRAAIHRSWAAEIVLMVDGDDADAGRVAAGKFGVRIVARPLEGDFAAQRNALQDASRAKWVLQLDADENLSAETGALLPALAAQCERENVVSVGLRRRNQVDGVVSDVFPDVQYRLNRRHIRYAGRVHERPVRDWQRSMISLHGAIEHEMSAAHVMARSGAYDALDPGQGRLEETERLLTPYRP